MLRRTDAQYLETNLSVRTDLEAAISFAVDQSC